MSLGCLDLKYQTTEFPGNSMEQAVVCCDLRNATLLDLSLPGTHDSMTYDLSDTLSDGYEGMGPVVSAILQLGACSFQSFCFKTSTQFYSGFTTVGRGVERFCALFQVCLCEIVWSTSNAATVSADCKAQHHSTGWRTFCSPARTNTRNQCHRSWSQL